ncbi:MAG: nuclear transport factor 2 family protein [Thermoleophilia bacterium]|jgi:ketosteroid isomerase-like protein|nr:nuclear transport factor 2 family protein [Thermoleophilia bacterium]
MPGNTRSMMSTNLTREHENLAVLDRVLDAFNAHDLDAIMRNFTADCVFEAPRGSEPWGTRFTGTNDVRRAFAGRFEGIPDAHYGEGSHFAAGSRGASEWTLIGTTLSGDRIEVRGCDLWTFGEDGHITRKDSFWKIRESRQ